MINLDKKIISYLGREPDFLNEIIIQDDRINNVSNPYIKEWNATDKPKPTNEQLNALESEATKLENNAIAVANRQKEYGSPEKMIEYITENGLEAWQSKVSEIKLKFPKENT